jgi:chromosome segregation ATPase
LYLKNITLRGFKSFGSRSSLDFEPGISVVVGPNGSGKSNVADGISWVLGEQSPKSLRGNSMGDVIFRSKKQEMGIAEVSLLFDNKDKMLDVEFRDVKITRRVYSAGGSDYFINSSPCRLMDIQELVADAGIGRGLHVIINQGQVNEITMLKPVDRKLVIDEVLGISKHKIRRKKSISRLSRVKDDIARLDDLMDEIKRTMDPLEIEAKRAREYAEAANELKKQEVSLFLSRMSVLSSSWEKLEQEHNKVRELIKETGDRILETEKQKGDLISNMGSRQAEYERWRTKVEAFDGGLNRLQNSITLVNSKKNVFSTLYNMFELEFKSGDAPYETAAEMARERQKEILDLSFMGKMVKRFAVLEVQFRDFVGRIKKALIGNSRLRQLEDEANILAQEIKDILEELREGNEARGSVKAEKASREILEKFEEEKRRKRARAEKMEELKRLCSLNLDRSEKIIGMLHGLKLASEKIQKRLYPEFDRQKRLISGSQADVEKLNSEINRLRVEANSLDNELYKIDLRREQVRDRVKDITSSIVDDYNMSVEYASKNFKPAEDEGAAETAVKKLKDRVRSYGNVNPNAAIEFAKIKKRYDFLDIQRKDLADSRQKLETLIKEINQKISTIFLEKFEMINQNFQKYFKALFPMGEGELILEKYRNDGGGEEELGVDLKVDIGNNKLVSLTLLSGGEKSLVSLAFLFSVFSINLSPFYIFDEADAALDDANIDKFQNLVKHFAKKQQIIIITHQKKTMEIADTIYGVTMQSDGISKVVSEKIENGKKTAAAEK